jgi:GMP reductase
MIKELFTYDDVYLRPTYSELTSRSLADTSVQFLGRKYKSPVIPANMADVISWDIADRLDAEDYFYIMHRFDKANQKIPLPLEDESCRFANISLGVNDESKRELDWMYENDIFPINITIDVAHGHHKMVKDMIEFIRPGFKKGIKEGNIIAGNVATADGYKFLCDLGVDAVKVGIGGGSICTTRYQTGFHLPTAYSIYECAELGMDVPIIADGGLKHYGDITKALALGATMVMSGGWFASCVDSPAQIFQGKKIYRGSTSFESKGHKKHIEGRTVELSEGVTYLERMDEIRQALCSSISYAGGRDLSILSHIDWQLL